MGRLLTVENEDGFIVLESGKKSVHSIDAQDITDALAVLIDDDNLDIGDASEADAIKNPASKIIYQQLHQAFKSVIDSRESIRSGLNSEFAEAETKYFGKGPSEKNATVG